MPPRPVAVITGASAGIGAEFARVFAANGHHVVLVARRHNELNALADEIADRGRPRPIVLQLDLAQRGAAAELRSALASHEVEPAWIVNNAGFGLAGDIAELDRDEQLSMIDLNVRTLTELSLMFVDQLARHGGGILNVASVAGFLPGPGMGVYYASKAFVVSFTEALHEELRPRGIKVSLICPGPVPTEFQARAGVPENAAPTLLERSPERVARDGFAALMAGRLYVVPGWPNWLVTLLPRVFPRRILLRIMTIAIDRHVRYESGQPTKAVPNT